MWTLFEAVWVCFIAVAEREHNLCQCSRLPMGSLGSLFAGNNIGDAGARDLGAALQVNTTLTTLECGCACGCCG
jgi:hypothetical protein